MEPRNGLVMVQLVFVASHSTATGRLAPLQNGLDNGLTNGLANGLTNGLREWSGHAVLAGDAAAAAGHAAHAVVRPLPGRQQAPQHARLAQQQKMKGA